MLFDWESPRTEPSLNDVKYTRLRQEIPNFTGKTIIQSPIGEDPFITNDDRIVVNIPSRKSSAQSDLIERSMIERNLAKQRPRRSSPLNSNYSNHIDQLLKDADNDWVYEKLLEKFENIRTRKIDRSFRSSSSSLDDNDDKTGYGVERIVERRYYVKKPSLGSKRNQLTSTSDLTRHGKKHRQLSGVSSESASCSGCSTPTYVESLRNQSKTLRNEIIDLRQEIEQLHTTQEEFIHELKTQFHAKPNSTTVSQNFAQLTPAKSRASGNKPIYLDNNQRTHSTSTESHSSLSSQRTSRQTTPTSEFTAKPFVIKSSPLSHVPAAPPISEFLANKNPSITPTPSANGNANVRSPPVTSASSINPNGNPISAFSAPKNTSTNIEQPSVARLPSGSGNGSLKSSSLASTPLASAYGNVRSPSISSESTTNSSVHSRNPSIVRVTVNNNSKPSSVASAPRVNTYVNVKNPSASPVSTVNTNANSRSASLAPTVSMNVNSNSKTSSVATTPLAHTYVNVPNPSAGPTLPMNTYGSGRNPLVASALPANANVNQNVPVSSVQGSSIRPPIHENEPTQRRVLSPRSQIVASGASISGLSDPLLKSITPPSLSSNRPKISQVLSMSLRDNEMQALTQYSSQLESSGFVPPIAPVINNPNASSTFWDSVDEYINQFGVGKTVTGLPPIPPSNRDNKFGSNHNTTRQLDKYDLEIKPQEFIESSVPFLMPPLDSIP